MRIAAETAPTPNNINRSFGPSLRARLFTGSKCSREHDLHLGALSLLQCSPKRTNSVASTAVDAEARHCRAEVGSMRGFAGFLTALVMAASTLAAQDADPRFRSGVDLVALN